MLFEDAHTLYFPDEKTLKAFEHRGNNEPKTKRAKLEISLVEDGEE